MTAITEKLAPVESPAQSRGRRPRRHLLRLGIAAVVLIAAAGIGGWWQQEGRWIESTDNAYVQGDIAVLSPRIEGDVLTIDVADNRRVHAGEPLVTLDPADWQLRVEQARAAVAEADAAVATARRQATQARSAIAQADAGVAQARAEQTRADGDATRARALVPAGAVSRQSYDLAIADQRKAAAATAAAAAQREAAEDALAVAEAQVAQAATKRASEAAALRIAERNLSYTVLRAPFDGIVGNRAAQPGQHVRPGAQVIAVTPLRRDLYVIANFKETQLRRMQPGQKVRLTPDIDGNAAIEGRVDSLAPATGALFSLLPPENATGNFTKVVQRVPVKIAIDPATAERAPWLRAGLSVTAEVDTRGPAAVRRGVFGSIAHLLGLA